MLLNFWPQSEDPMQRLPTSDLRREWKLRLLTAREEALDGRFPAARGHLEALLMRLRQEAEGYPVALQFKNYR